MNHRSRSLTVTLASIFVLAPLAAYGGAKSSFPVTINESNRSVGGAIGSTRNGANTIEYIGCRFSNYTPTNGTEGTRFALCWARNAAGLYKSCEVRNSGVNLYDNAKLLSSSSYLSFVYPATGSLCEALYVTTSSANEPPVP